MVNKVFWSIALTLLFVGLASAQVRLTKTIHEQGLAPSVSFSGPAQPTYCSPCLFYGGDFGNPTQNGLYNGNTAASATVYVPFTIPKKPRGDWSVSGAFGNIQYYPSSAVFGAGNGPFATDVQWSISTGLVAGSPPPAPICSGDTVYSDNGASELLFTGRIAFGFYGEYTTPVTITGCPVLEESKKGSLYWLTTVPQWSGSFELSYLSDAEFSGGGCSGTPGANASGPVEPCDNGEFFLSPGFGFPNLTPAYGSTGVCGGFGCDAFSSGIEGTVVR